MTRTTVDPGLLRLRCRFADQRKARFIQVSGHRRSGGGIQRRTWQLPRDPVYFLPQQPTDGRARSKPFGMAKHRKGHAGGNPLAG